MGLTSLADAADAKLSPSTAAAAAVEQEQEPLQHPADRWVVFMAEFQPLFQRPGRFSHVCTHKLRAAVIMERLHLLPTFGGMRVQMVTGPWATRVRFLQTE